MASKWDKCGVHADVYAWNVMRIQNTDAFFFPIIIPTCCGLCTKKKLPWYLIYTFLYISQFLVLQVDVYVKTCYWHLKKKSHKKVVHVTEENYFCAFISLWSLFPISNGVLWSCHCEAAIVYSHHRYRKTLFHVLRSLMCNHRTLVIIQ